MAIACSAHDEWRDRPIRRRESGTRWSVLPDERDPLGPALAPRLQVEEVGARRDLASRGVAAVPDRLVAAGVAPAVLEDAHDAPLGVHDGDEDAPGLRQIEGDARGAAARVRA